MPSNDALKGALDIIGPYLAPPDPERHVYSILREILLRFFVDFLKAVFSDKSVARTVQMSHSQKMMREIHSWLIPASGPLTAEQALRMIQGKTPPVLRDAILRSVGKRRGRGQPAVKRHLAILALDMKYTSPGLTLRASTDTFCPCGKGVGEHGDKCREQLRQQINRAVKLLRTFGYDFTWERVGTDGWKEKIE
jgi:hypothetical protein